MDLRALQAFGIELEKRAISAGATLKLLQGRAAQGARIAPAMMARAEGAAASGLAHTPASMRHLALGAGDAARLQQRTTAAAPMKAGLQNRIRSAEAMPAAAQYSGTPLKHHDAFNATHAYSKAHVDAIAGPAGRIADPKGLLVAPVRGSAASAATVPAARNMATVPNARRRSLATAPTQVVA
jgi:hypothetical protein